MDKLSDDELERRIGADKSDSRSSAERAAEDWLSAFAKKSQEALAARDAEKQISPKPDEKALVEVLARKDHTEYDRVRGEVAETLGIRVGTLDDKVEAIRKKRAALDDDALPHWKVDPWPEPVDGAELLNSIKQVFRRYIRPRVLTSPWRYGCYTLGPMTPVIFRRSWCWCRQPSAAARPAHLLSCSI